MPENITFTSSRGRIIEGTLYLYPGDAGVILCPPHPLYGGNRYDLRLALVAEELCAHHISVLSIDYGGYGGGVQEIEDVLSAIHYLKEQKDDIGLFGYSFGAVVAFQAAARTRVKGLVLMALLKKVDQTSANLESDCPKLFIHGTKDIVAPYRDFEELYSQAGGTKERLIVETDHFYSGKAKEVAQKVREFFGGIFGR